MMMKDAASPSVNGAMELPTVDPRHVSYEPLKRALDIVVTSVLLIVLLPLFLILTLLVKLSSPGPIIYRSERIGCGGQPFMFLKFRSMYVDADQRLNELLGQNDKDGPIFKMKNDPRVTSIGKWMRKFSLDELPQLINVLRGDMSLVGPRPPIRREVVCYDERALERLSIRPGITCYWQVMGRSRLSFDEWIDLDHRYLREMGLLTDLKILALTPIAVLKGDGAY